MKIEIYNWVSNNIIPDFFLCITKSDYLKHIMINKNITGVHGKTKEYLHHFVHILEVNLKSSVYYLPIKNDSILNAADSVIINHQYNYIQYNYIQIKTIFGPDTYLKKERYNSNIRRYSIYCDTIEYGFLYHENYILHKDLIKNTLDLSEFLEEADQEWMTYVDNQLDLYKKTHNQEMFTHYNEIYMQQHYKHLTITDSKIE